jgi:hypothetical protein
MKPSISLLGSSAFRFLTPGGAAHDGGGGGAPCTVGLTEIGSSPNRVKHASVGSGVLSVALVVAVTELGDGDDD